MTEACCGTAGLVRRLVVFLFLSQLLPVCVRLYGAVELPESLYVVEEGVSDASPFAFWYILNVRPEGTTARIRIIHMAPRECGGLIVQAIETGIPADRLQGLLRTYDLCSLEPAVIERATRPRRKPVAIDDTAQFGIVARCALREKVFHIPFPEKVNLKHLEARSPRIAQLWTLFWRISDEAFGKAPLFYDISRQRDLELQQFAQTLIPELHLFANGFSESSSLQNILAHYRGLLPVLPLPPELVEKNQFRFITYKHPPYPPVAKQARISGVVKIQLLVDSITGEVKDVTWTSGHRLFRESTVLAAKQWQFDPHSGDFESPVSLTLKFSLDCP